MPVKGWLDWIQTYHWELMVGTALLFFVLLLVFIKPIRRWLSSQGEILIQQPTWTGKTYQSTYKKANEGKYEGECRRIFEKLFMRPFPSVRPDFLKRSNGRNLELDGYNADLKLGFEYQGSQHAKFNRRWHRSQKDFANQVQRDKDKRILCARHGVVVVEIPHTVPFNKLETYIRARLREMGRL